MYKLLIVSALAIQVQSKPFHSLFLSKSLPLLYAWQPLPPPSAPAPPPPIPPQFPQYQSSFQPQFQPFQPFPTTSVLGSVLRFHQGLYAPFTDFLNQKQAFFRQAPPPFYNRYEASPTPSFPPSFTQVPAQVYGPPGPSTTGPGFLSQSTFGPVNVQPIYGLPNIHTPGQNWNSPQPVNVGSPLPVATHPTSVLPIGSSSNLPGPGPTYLPPGRPSTVKQIGMTPGLDTSTPSSGDSDTNANEISSQTAATKSPTTIGVSPLTTKQLSTSTTIESTTTPSTIALSTTTVLLPTEPSSENIDSSSAPESSSGSTPESKITPSSSAESAEISSEPSESSSVPELSSVSSPADESSTTIPVEETATVENDVNNAL